MVHLVPDEGVDSGPVLAEAVVDIRADDDLKQRLGYLLDGEQQRQRHCGNERGRQVNHSPLAENEGRTSDGSDGRGSDSMHKSLYLLVLGEAPVVGGSD